MGKRKRAMRRFQTWRVQRNRIRLQYEKYQDFGEYDVEVNGEDVWVRLVHSSGRYRMLRGRSFWSGRRKGKLRDSHIGCGCKGCKPWKWFKGHERAADRRTMERMDFDE